MKSTGLIPKVSNSACVVAILFIFIPQLRAGSIDVSVGNGGNVVVQTRKGVVHANKVDVTQMVFGSSALQVLTGRMRFTIGNETGHQGGDYFFGGGGSLTVTGCVDLNHDSDKKCDRHDFHGTLLTAKFLNAAIVEKAGQYFLQAEVLETIDPRLAALLKLSKDTYLAKLDLALTLIGQNRWALRSSVLSGSLITLAEPSSLVLLFCSLIAIAFHERRRRTGPGPCC